jgi:hypothetical protein
VLVLFLLPLWLKLLTWLVLLRLVWLLGLVGF